MQTTTLQFNFSVALRQLCGGVNNVFAFFLADGILQICIIYDNSVATGWGRVILVNNFDALVGVKTWATGANAGGSSCHVLSSQHISVTKYHGMCLTNTAEW